MPHYFTYAAFEGLVAELNRRDRSISGTNLVGRQHVAIEMWERFARCFEPPIPPFARYPEPTSCEPSTYRDEGGPRAVFLRRAKLRTRDLHGYELGQSNVGKSAKGLGSTTPIDEAATQSAADETTIVSDLVATDGFDRLRHLIRTEFRPRVRYRAEVRAALLAAVDEVEAGTHTDLVAAADELLQAWLPDEFGTEDAAKQRRKRARTDMAVFLERIRPLFSAPDDPPEAHDPDPRR